MKLSQSEYKQPYYILFGALEDIVNAIEKQNYGIAKELIIKAQRDAEEAYISFGEE